MLCVCSPSVAPKQQQPEEFAANLAKRMENSYGWSIPPHASLKKPPEHEMVDGLWMHFMCMNRSIPVDWYVLFTQINKSETRAFAFARMKEE